MDFKPGVLFLCADNSPVPIWSRAFLPDMTGDEFEIAVLGTQG
jgi:hypothetical protein